MTDIVERLTGARIAALVGRLEGEKIWITEPRPANDIEIQAANTIRALATEALESRAEIERLRAALADRRMCVNCGRYAPEGHDRSQPLPECVDADGFSACTFDTTPQEAWKIWQGRYYEKRAEIERLRAALATARGWFQDYADGHAAKGDADKAQRNQDRADFCARAALGDHLAGAGKMGGDQ